MPQRIGFAGLGLMGSRMARQFLDKGFPLAVWNRTPAKAKPLQDRGRVRSRSLLFDQRRRAPVDAVLVRIATAVRRETELAEQDVATVPEPTGHAR